MKEYIINVSPLKIDLKFFLFSEIKNVFIYYFNILRHEFFFCYLVFYKSKDS